MFDKAYNLKGIHALKLKKLADKDDKNRIFNRYIDIYILAPIIGFIYQQRADINTQETQETASIFADILIEEKDTLLFNYRLIMLLDDKYEPNTTNRIDNAFRYFSDDTKNTPHLDRYHEYVRGGIDFLYDKIFNNNESDKDEIIKNIFNIVYEFNDRYNNDLSVDEILNATHK